MDASQAPKDIVSDQLLSLLASPDPEFSIQSPAALMGRNFPKRPSETPSRPPPALGVRALNQRPGTGAPLSLEGPLASGPPPRPAGPSGLGPRADRKRSAGSRPLLPGLLGSAPPAATGTRRRAGRRRRPPPSARGAGPGGGGSAAGLPRSAARGQRRGPRASPLLRRLQGRGGRGQAQSRAAGSLRRRLPTESQRSRSSPKGAFPRG